jgi:hypothetical protein
MIYILKHYTNFQLALKIKHNDFEKTYNNFYIYYKNYLYIDNILKNLPIKHFYKNFYEINFNKMISKNNFQNINAQYLKNVKKFKKNKITYDDILLSKSFFPSYPTSFKFKKKEIVNYEKFLDAINLNFPLLINAMKKNPLPLNENSIYTTINLRFKYLFKDYIKSYKSIAEAKHFYSFKPNKFINLQKIILSNIESYKRNKRNKFKDYIFLKNLFSNEQTIHDLAIYLQNRKKNIYYENLLGTNNIYNELQLYKFPNAFHVNIFPYKKKIIKEKIILPVTEALIYFKIFKI